MTKIFLNIINMSISASWIVLAVLLLRLLLKKAPKWIFVLLWGIVAIRLVCPFSFESVLSLIPSAQTISPEIMTDKTPEINTGIPYINNSVNPIIHDSFTPSSQASTNPLQIWIPVLTVIWLAGIVILLIYTIISYLRISKKVKTAVVLKDNIYQCETVASPFVLGLIKPNIYLPFYIEEQDAKHVIAHEQAHIRRKDYLWKPFGFLFLTLHWFNPFMWLGYVLLCRDIELACDEKVVKELNNEQRADYSQALLTCSIHHPMIAACPLAFGEVSVKKRVKNVLNYKKPAFWILGISVIAVIIASICLLTNPSSTKLENIEKLTLDSITESTIQVYIGDGEAYQLVGAVNKELLQELAGIQISRTEISNNRSEDRDTSHTLVLQTEQDTKPAYYSYLKCLYIHFNSDFTSVWVNTGVKPTLSYKVINPKEAEEIYNLISSYDVNISIIEPTNSISLDEIEHKFPNYFDLTTDKGLEVYIWQMSKDSYSCGLLPARDTGYTKEEIWNLHVSPATLEEMRLIIASYMPEISQNDVAIIPYPMPHSSYLYNIDDTYRKNLTKLFWSGFSTIPDSSQYPS